MQETERFSLIFMKHLGYTMNPLLSTALTNALPFPAMRDFRKSGHFYSTGPKSFAESGFAGGNSMSMGPNNFGESDGIAVFLEEGGDLTFL